MKLKHCLCVFLLFGSSSAWTQESDSWDWKIAPYLWTVGISGDLTVGDGVQPIDVKFSDILSDFDFGGSVLAEFGKGNHAVHFDYTYIRLKSEEGLPTPPFPMDSALATKMTINIFEPAYNYRFNGAGSTALVFGARYMDIALRLTPEINLPDPFPELPIEGPGAIEFGPNWWDYFIGIKTHNQISTNWDFDFYGTVGGGGSDLPWTVQGMFGRRFSNDNRLGLGVRVWNIDYDANKGLADQYTRIDAIFYGLMIGYEFN